MNEDGTIHVDCIHLRMSNEKRPYCIKELEDEGFDMKKCKWLPRCHNVIITWTDYIIHKEDVVIR